jgi:hypothetical protein
VLDVTLTAAQKSALDAQAQSDANAEVGSCIFTSWHFDVPGPAPSCSSDGSCPSDLPSYLALDDFRDDIWQMQSHINSNSAARLLVEPCMHPAQGKKDPTIADVYTRGCMLDSSIFHTEWRKSDPTICTAAMRLGECACGTDASKVLPPAAAARAVAEALIPPPPRKTQDVVLRGFPLGTWSGLQNLPEGCRYASGKESSGQPSQTLVACKLTAGDILGSLGKGLKLGDLKDVCRGKYGNDVVVHIPLPTSALSCSSPQGATCSAQPWDVTR